mmetsp:Transcript_98851/g.316930  ORF Transcript_98851/g.316930 Transcript_98851/m.316930 type:complete len:229 (+) Transcript_98851:1446-2132(+)
MTFDQLPVPLNATMMETSSGHAAASSAAPAAGVREAASFRASTRGPSSSTKSHRASVSLHKPCLSQRRLDKPPHAAVILSSVLGSGCGWPQSSSNHIAGRTGVTASRASIAMGVFASSSLANTHRCIGPVVFVGLANGLVAPLLLLPRAGVLGGLPTVEAAGLCVEACARGALSGAISHSPNAVLLNTAFRARGAMPGSSSSSSGDGKGLLAEELAHSDVHAAGRAML